MENTPRKNSRHKVISEPLVSPLSNSSSLTQIIVGLFVLLLVVGISAYFFGRQSSIPSFVSNNSPKTIEIPFSSSQSAYDDQVTCTADAKFCPDGSSVGRTGPDCEFEECPVTAKGGVLRLTVPSNSKTLSGESRSIELPVVPVPPDTTPTRMTIHGVVYQVQNTMASSTDLCPWGVEAEHSACERVEEPFPHADYLFVWKDAKRGVFALNTGNLKVGKVSTDVIVVSKENKGGFTHSELQMWKQILQTLKFIEYSD